MKVERYIRRPYHRSHLEVVVTTVLGFVGLFILVVLIYYVTP